MAFSTAVHASHPNPSLSARSTFIVWIVAITLRRDVRDVQL
jgi:hypothetical protein